jgi:ABC-type branched-subunit amino acid transport system substrate-binding protein/serine/threonine protein kinase
MDIYCTRPHCEQPLNSFDDLDSSKFLKPLHQKYCINCGTPLVLASRYLPLKLLGDDESKVTFIGYDFHNPKLKRCKIEQLRFKSDDSPTQVEIATKVFYQQAKILEKLGEHPKIPRFFAAIEAVAPASHLHPQSKFFYLVQDYIEGQNLAEELRLKGKFTETEVVTVLREVARILEFVHFQNVVHGNIQPSKIVRDLQSKIYLVDFAEIEQIAARTVHTSRKLPEHNLVSVLTPVSTPEKQHLSQDINPASDLHNLAITCLNLLTGKQPKYLLNIETNIWQWRAPNLQVSDSLADILDRMLQHQFASARDILDALDANLGMPILSIPTTSIPITSISTGSTVLLDNPYDDPFQLDEDFSQIDDDLLQLDRDIFQIDDRFSQFNKIPQPRDNTTSQIRYRSTPKDKKPWIFGGVITAGIVGLIAMIMPKLLVSSPQTAIVNDPISRRSSIGERILLSFEGGRDTEKFKELKRSGVLAIANKNYPEAVTKLRLALVENPNSPETRIYLNNALIGNNKSYTIATAAPIARSLNRASEMLRGFAQAQAEINQIGGVNEAKIKLKIIDDSDDPKVIDSIANAVVGQPEILGVVGHNRNDVTLKAANIYSQGKLAFIAPISTVNNLTKPNRPYIFRTNANTNAITQQLVDRLIEKEHKQKVAIFSVPNVAYNDEFKTQFVNRLTAKGGKLVCVFPFSNSSKTKPTFDAEVALEQAHQMGAEAILVLPIGRSNHEALKVLKHRASKYPSLSIFGDNALYSFNTLKAGKETEDLILSVPWQESESTPQFSIGASQLWNTQVNWATATSYNAVKALGTAIKAQEPPSRAGVMKILSEGEFMGASGRFQFTNGESTGRYTLVRVSKTPASYKYSSRTGYDFVPLD